MPVFFHADCENQRNELEPVLSCVAYFLSLCISYYHNTCSICCPEYYPMAMTFLMISKRTDSSWFNMYESYKFFVKTLAREYPLSIPKIQVISDSTCAQVMLLSLFRFHVSLVSKTNKNQIKIYAIPFIFYFYKISTRKSY